MRQKHSFKEIVAMAKAAASSWSDDYAPSMGAALAYYTVFSIAPLILIVVSIAGLVFGRDAAQGALFDQLNSMMGRDAAGAIQGLLKSVSKPSEGAIGTTIGVVVLIVGATTVFGELQDAMDRIWRAPARKEGGLWALLRTRFLSFGMILCIAFLLMVSLIASTAVSALGKWWSPVFGDWEVLAHAVTFVIGFALTTVVFAMIYKLMPRVSVRWYDVWIGAAVTSLLFSIGRFLISLYIGKSGVASGFGAAGSLIVVFVWVYYSAQIFLMGAEFTWVYARTFGSMKHLPDAVTSPPRSDLPTRSSAPRPSPATVPAPDPAARPVGWTLIGTGLVAGIALGGVALRLLR